MKKITSLLLFVMMLLPFACQVEDHGREGGGTSRNGFMLNYLVSGTTSGTTKASVNSVEGEDNLATLYLLFFDYSNNGSGEFIEAVDLTQQGQSLGSMGSINLEFDADSDLSNVEDYVLLFLGNSDKYFSETSFDDVVDLAYGKTEDEVIQLFNYTLDRAGTAPDDFTATPLVDIESLPMSARAVKMADEETVSVEIIRSVTRFDLKNNDSDYTLVSASVWNVYPEISVFNRSFFEYNEERIKRLYGINADENHRITGGLYGFENFVAGPQQGDKETTCVIVGLKNNDDGVTYYYRANINATNLGQQLKRNNVYSTTINKVLGKGANNEETAWADQNFLLDLDINGWDVDHNGNVQTDGENVLAIPVSKIPFSYSAETVAHDIFTLGDETLEISKQMLFPGLSVSLSGKKLTVSVEDSDVDQAGYVELRFGSLTATITITQTGSLTERLDLSVTTLPSFESVAPSGTNPITVTSSGAWNATIYNGENFFSHTLGSSSTPAVKEVNGVSGETFQIYCNDSNTDPKARFAFVLVSLVDNPEVSRVIVLMQKGAGGVELSQSSIHFDPLGFNSFSQTISITVDASDGDAGQTQLPWSVQVMAGTGNFSYDDSDPNILLITASENLTNAPLSSLFRIRTDNGAFADLTVTQDVHQISYDPTSITAISTDGGLTSEIKVTSTGPWTATVSSTGNDAFFEGTDQKTITGADGDKFQIGFPRLNNGNITPEATITLTVTGTQVTRNFKVTQQSLNPREFSIKSYSTAAASLNNANDAATAALRGFMNDRNKFGSTGTVYVPGGFNFAGTETTPASGTVVYQLTYTNPTVPQATSITNWWGNNGNILLYLTNRAQSRHTIILNNKGYAVAALNTSNSAGATNRTVASTTNNKVMDYLLNGPFSETSLNTADIAIRSTSTSAALSSWPSTFKPILYLPNGRCVVGVDPTTQFIFIGDPNIFNNSVGNFTTSGSREANEIFMSNLVAWLANAAMYGADFMDQFR